jgi:hypothetical protein
MTSFASKFELFYQKLNECPYDLPSELKPVLLESLKHAGFDAVTTVTVTAAAAKGTDGKKKLSGYNVFMKEKMAELKAENVPSAERMTKVGSMWKALSDADKKIWNDKAKGTTSSTASVEHETVSGETKIKKLSGYQLYVKETMPAVKVMADIKSTERMTEIGKRWKALSKDEQLTWTNKAKSM